MDAPGAPGLAACAGSATWPALSGRHRAWGVTGRGTGVFPPLRWATGARAGSACVPAGRSDRPLLARAVAVRPAAQSRLG
jgi:hypothetical protein